MKFSEIEYKRPDVEALKSKIVSFTDAFCKAESYEGAREIFLDYDSVQRKIDSDSNVAHIRHSIDTRDKFYEGEQNFWNEVEPELEEYSQKWNEALLNTPFREDFEREYGDVMFLKGEISKKAFSPEIVSDMKEENKLVTEYEKLLATAKIPFEGEEYTLPQMTALKTDPDDVRRLNAWKAEGNWYKQNQKTLDDIYDKLVSLRDKMGRTLGYGGYTQLGYYRMERNCYTREDVEKFREGVIKHLVPLADRIYRDQAKRLGLEYPMSFADNALEFRSGNPRPKGSPDDILMQGKKFYDDLSPETSEFFNMMLEGELLDVLSKPGKQGGGYCTNICDYRVPFIFANFNGTQGDVEVVTHEAGHAFSYYMNRDRIPMQNTYPSLEACEVHSMSMEFFAWKNAEGFFGEDADKFCYSHLAGALTFIPYGTMVDHFQHIIYDNPGLSKAERHEKWKELLGIYMPWQKLDGEIPVYSEGEGWQRQQHIYSLPFYYIDYCLAQVVALQFFARIQEDEKKAWECYMAYTRQGGSETFLKLLENAGLDSPFSEEIFKNICDKANAWLDNFDMTGIK